MLDLNYVRENLNIVFEALEKRNFPNDLLLRFEAVDKERREAIRISYSYNADLNKKSREIGELIKAGQNQDARQRPREVKTLTESVAQSDPTRPSPPPPP